MDSRNASKDGGRLRASRNQKNVIRCSSIRTVPLALGSHQILPLLGLAGSESCLPITASEELHLALNR